MLRPMRNLMAVLALLIVPAGLTAQQQQMAPPQPELPEEVQAWISEIEQLQAQLAPVQQEALQDEEIQAQQEALGAEVEAAMQAIDPELAILGDRMDQLQAEAEAAQEEGDMEKLQGLSQEAGQIQQRFQAVQGQVLERPEIAEKVESFQDNLQSKMVEIEPEAAVMLERFEELASRIEEAMGDPTRG